jgi:hypothetical protein
VELNFSLTLPDALYHELIEACQGSNCSPKQFAAETLEGALASRRLPRVYVPPLTQGAQHARGTRIVTVEEPKGYRVHWPEGISGTQE